MGRPASQVDAAKKKIGQGARVTAEKARSGVVAMSDLRSTVDIETHRAAAARPTKNRLLFETFGRTLADRLSKMLAEDDSAFRLGEVETALKDITAQEDAETVARVRFELDALSTRVLAWQKRLTPTSKKVISLLDRAQKEVV